MKKIKYIFAVLGLSLALTGCEHALSETSVIEPLETASNKKSITISGTINSSGATSRTATSSFDGDITWIITAYSTDKSANGRSVSRNFTLECPVAGTWTILVLGYPGYHPDGSVGSTEAIFSGTQANITVTDEGLESPLQITATPLQALRNPNSEVAGSISLDISSESADVKKVQAKLKAYPNGTETIQASASFSDGETTLSIDDIASGSYVARLFFEDNDGNNLYACTEMINVYPGMETNLWYGTAPYFNDVDGRISFVLTSEVLNSYVAERTMSTDYVLYSGNTVYRYNLLDGIASHELLSEQANCKRIKSDFDSEGNVYTLFDTSVYPEYGLSLCRNGNATGEINVARSSDGYYFKWFSIDRASDTFYFSRIIREGYGNQSYALYKCPKNSLSTFINSIDDYDFTISGISDSIIKMNKFSVYNDIMYIASGSSLKAIDVSDIGDTTEGTKPELSSSNVQTYSYTGGEFSTVTDLLYQDKAVYILNQIAENNAPMNDSGNGITIKRKGAVVRFSTITKTFTTLGLNDTNTPLATEGKKLYTYGLEPYEVKDYQYFTDADHTSHLIAKADDISYSTTRPATLNLYFPVSERDRLCSTEFYAPRAFVAIKPKQLVIADDGLAVYTDAYGFFRCRNVNRVVVVDLDDFAISETKEFSNTITFAEETTKFPISVCAFNWGPENLYDENGELFFDRSTTPTQTIYYQEGGEDKFADLSFSSIIVSLPVDTE